MSHYLCANQVAITIIVLREEFLKVGQVHWSLLCLVSLGKLRLQWPINIMFIYCSLTCFKN